MSGASGRGRCIAPFLLRQILARFATVPEWKNARHILLYLALHGEIMVESLALRDDFRTFYVPRIAPRHALTVHPYTPGGTPLLTNVWGLRQPAHSVPEASPEVLDLVIVPGLLFDESGNRLGYGGGYYDRFLPRLRPDCITIGVAAGIAPALPMEAHDVPVQIIVTPGRTFRRADTTEPIPPPYSD